MLDRSVPPPIKVIDSITLLPLQTFDFANGLKVHTLHSSESEIIQLDFFFKAGRIYQHKKLLVDAFVSLITNGTLKHSAKEIAEALEYYGVFYKTEAFTIHSKFQFTFLKRNFSHVLPTIEEIIKQSSFPQEELDIYIQRHIEQYQTLIKNVAVMAEWQYSKLIYGDNHPLNKLHTPEDYKNITRDDLLYFFTTHIHPKNGFVFLSGNIDEHLIDLLNTFFGKNDFNQVQYLHEERIPPVQSNENHLYIHIPDAVQSAIKIGMPVNIHPHHPDYFDFVIANTLLGGFFGSRLMSVIREEKGYTYGIYSTLSTHGTYSVFSVTSEIKAEHTNESIEEIIHQIEMLQNTPPREEELNIVKNYLCGEILDTTDGILKQTNAWESLIVKHLDKEYYNRFLSRIKDIQPEEVSDVMKKHVNTEQLKKCIVGKL